MTDNKRAIEKRSESWLKQRIEMNRAARFGLQDATAEQLNIIYILCRRWRLDPVTDITLYQGQPWIKLEGHLRLMREHPDYQGFSQRPLTPAEKVLWGYADDDIVVETTIRTAHWGEITQWGKVTRAEINEAVSRADRDNKRSAPVGLHPVEIAQKRSVARTHRAAFGQDAPDEAQIEQEIAEEMLRRNDPKRVAALAERYDEIYPADEPLAFAAAPPPTPEVPPKNAEGITGSPGTSASAGAAPQAAGGWQRNRELMAEAYDLGLRLRELPSTATPAEIELRNRNLEEAIAQRSR